MGTACCRVRASKTANAGHHGQLPAHDPTRSRFCFFPFSFATWLLSSEPCSFIFFSFFPIQKMAHGSKDLAWAPRRPHRPTGSLSATFRLPPAGAPLAPRVCRSAMPCSDFPPRALEASGKPGLCPGSQQPGPSLSVGRPLASGRRHACSLLHSAPRGSDGKGVRSPGAPPGLTMHICTGFPFSLLPCPSVLPPSGQENNAALLSEEEPLEKHLTCTNGKRGVFKSRVIDTPVTADALGGILPPLDAPSLRLFVCFGVFWLSIF